PYSRCPAGQAEWSGRLVFVRCRYLSRGFMETLRSAIRWVVASVVVSALCVPRSAFRARFAFRPVTREADGKLREPKPLRRDPKTTGNIGFGTCLGRRGQI